MQGLVDRSLAEVRIAAGLPVEHRLFSVAGFIAEIRLSASLEAQVRECAFTISAVDPALAIDGDRDLLLAAVGNLLQNAFKFTRPHTESRRMPTQPATASSSTSRTTAAAFQGATPKACSCRSPRWDWIEPGLGLGLSIARVSVEANAGILSVRDARLLDRPAAPLAWAASFGTAHGESRDVSGVPAQDRGRDAGLMLAVQLPVRAEMPDRFLLQTVRLAQQREVVVRFRQIRVLVEGGAIHDGGGARPLQVFEQQREIEEQRLVPTAARKAFPVRRLCVRQRAAFVQQPAEVRVRRDGRGVRVDRLPINGASFVRPRLLERDRLLEQRSRGDHRYRRRSVEKRELACRCLDVKAKQILAVVRLPLHVALTDDDRISQRFETRSPDTGICVGSCVCRRRSERRIRVVDATVESVERPPDAAFLARSTARPFQAWAITTTIPGAAPSRPAARYGALGAPPTGASACVCIRCRTWLPIDPRPNIERTSLGGALTTTCAQR
jgi:hypothetical protein